MAQESEDKAAAGSKGGFVMVLALLALIGAGAGAGFSLMFLNTGATAPETAAAKPDIQAGKSTKAGEGSASGGSGVARIAESRSGQVVSLDPILVTLAGPQRSWARLELGVVLADAGASEDAVLLKSVTEDIMSFMRTVPLVHIESAAGIEYLREDIQEIARLRTKGRARDVILRSLVVE